eukprot:GHVP01055143.1.p1 GENE.GHVP01055143.1~~GHVP01055143.1.p1  ORF type:complete len:192 (-),score=29.75 GHVP01055143.1:168-743(-)
MSDALQKGVVKTSYGSLGFGEGVGPDELLKDLNKITEEADNFRDFTKLFQMGVIADKGEETHKILGLIKDHNVTDLSKPPIETICFKEKISVPAWGLLCCLYPQHHLSFSWMQVVDEVPEGSVPVFLLGFRHGNRLEFSNVLTVFTDGPLPTVGCVLMLFSPIIMVATQSTVGECWKTFFGMIMMLYLILI